MAAFYTYTTRVRGPTYEALDQNVRWHIGEGREFPDDILTHYTFTSEDWEIWETFKQIGYNEKMAYNYVEFFINNRGYLDSLKKDTWVKGEGNLVKPGSLALAAALNWHLESVAELLLEHGVSPDIDDRVRKSLGLCHYSHYWSGIPRVLERIQEKRQQARKWIKPDIGRKEEEQELLPRQAPSFCTAEDVRMVYEGLAAKDFALQEPKGVLTEEQLNQRRLQQACVLPPTPGPPQARQMYTVTGETKST